MSTEAATEVMTGQIHHHEVHAGMGHMGMMTDNSVET